MARPQASDYMQGFRFHVRTSDGKVEYVDSTRGEAGFNSVTLPELSTESVEYREGHMTYTEKMPGVPTVGQVSLQRGVTKADSAFWNWIQDCVQGREYRTTLTVYHWPRDGKTKGIGDLSKARQYVCYEAFASRCKPGGDLEGTSGDVSMAELDVEIEYFEVIPAP